MANGHGQYPLDLSSHEVPSPVRPNRRRQQISSPWHDLLSPIEEKLEVHHLQPSPCSSIVRGLVRSPNARSLSSTKFHLISVSATSHPEHHHHHHRGRSEPLTSIREEE